MLGRRLEQLLNEIRQRRNEHEFVQIKSAKEKTLPYHSMKKSTMKKKANGGGLTKKQKTLPKQLQQKIMASKKKKMK